MKRITAALMMLLLLCSCSFTQPQKSRLHTVNGIWLTADEIAVNGDSEKQYREKIAEIIDRIVSNGLSDIFVQLRPNCDALYPSEIFPENPLSSSDFDIFRIISDTAHAKDVFVHAWINPYRVSTAVKQMKKLPEDSPALSLYKKDKTSVMVLDSGIYLNPANQAAQKLIIDGVREILCKYNVDGIHIDDYFYPSDIGNADEKSYKAYKENGGTLSLADFRKTNVSALVSGIYSAVKAYDGECLFSVSPSADIEKCNNNYYADVKAWCSESGYCDIIIPQIYFGFENEFLPFEDCLEQWVDICNAEKLCIGLALYKQGKQDNYAASGKYEWIEDDGIIQRQMEICTENGCGICLFSYSFLSENS